MNDVIVNKVSSIQRCIKRAREEYVAAENFEHDHTRQDAAVLNVVRACEQAIDLANHIVRKRKWGIPANSRESFTRLADEGFLEPELADKLSRMVGFRNVAVHAYQSLDVGILVAVIEQGLDDLLRYTEIVVEGFSEE